MPKRGEARARPLEVDLLRENRWEREGKPEQAQMQMREVRARVLWLLAQSGPLAVIEVVAGLSCGCGRSQGGEGTGVRTRSRRGKTNADGETTWAEKRSRSTQA